MSKILIVDDHPLYREGVMSALRGHPLRALVLGASSAAEALRILDDDPTVDLVLVDLRLGSEDGLKALGQIGARHPSIARMLISAYDSDDIVHAAVRAGAQGFLRKSQSIGEALSGIRSVLEGGVYWPGAAPSGPPPSTGSARSPREPGAAALHGLTIRQLEVLHLLGEGKSNAEIAEDLGISERTAKAHLKGIFDALGVDTRVRALVRAREWGLLKDG
jgi:DNA-binding NarL/FixJ family response regulator